MEGLDCLEYRPASPEFVLSVFKHGLRALQVNGEAEADFELTMETTIHEWRDAVLDDFFSWRRFAEGLNKWWRIDAPMDQWKSALTPTRTRTVRDVCIVIARYAQRPCFHAATVLGKECAPAGVFFAVRSLLAQEGADVRHLSPSTPLHEFARRHLGVFTGLIVLLAPSKVPYPKITYLPLAIANWCALLSWAVLVLGVFLNPWLTIVGTASLVLTFAAAMTAAHLRPTSVEFPGLATFRDFAKLLASSPCDFEAPGAS